MFAFIVRRLLQAVMVMLAVAFIAFSMFNFVGDPIVLIAGQDASAEQREDLRKALGLDLPTPQRFVKYVTDAAQGNFGLSYRTTEKVGKMIADRLPATLELSFMAALMALLLGIPMGVFTGLYPKLWVSRMLLAVSLVGISLPTFLIGILLIVIFAVVLGWLPSFGRGDVVQIGFWSTGFLTLSGWKAILMPAFTLGLFQMTLIMRLVRSEMLEVLRTDYIKFARARGLHNRAVHFGHALKNTMVPVITITGLQVGSIIAFAIITETVFSWPGLGLLFLQSVQNVDIPVMSSYLVLIGFLFVMINLIVDILYFVVDPRLRGQSGGGVAK
ncbi:ABC transporter permease [Ferrovibrio sp.]|uniref:ABC transporter permease n=1 Tax=Ferrovibrio sp. TaxID=1917215 RepID=UPI0025C65239|nr:ABC transporter permease [Ferrovibrio sp.]MBX3455290.1 ABC transporter permease [Ferrovibrio sp.]